MKKIDRKDFLKIGAGAAAGGVAGYVLSGAPFMAFQALAEWTQDQYVPVNGIESYLQTVSDTCTSGCKVSVRKIGARSIKIESAEGVCPSCMNALQLVYHPERIATPLKLTGKKGSGKYKAVSWDEAFKDIATRMNALVAGGEANSIAAINKNETLSGQMMEKFVRSAGSNNVYYESSLKSVESAVLGGYLKYDFAGTDYILSFGSRLLEGWGDSVQMNKFFLGWKTKGTKLVQADTVCTRTASLADEWVPVKPGTEAILAYGIAYHLITAKKRSSSGADFTKWSQMIINKYPLQKVAALTGIKEERIIKIAEDFSKARRPVAVAGKGGAGAIASSAEIIAVHCLNTLVKTNAVSVVKNSAVSYKSDFSGIDGLVKNGNFKMLILNDSNPVYKSVLGNDLKKKMEKSFVVSINTIKNDSSEYADYILPALTFLETETPGNKPVNGAWKEAIDAKDIIIKLSKMVDKTARALPFDSAVDAYRGAGRETAAGAGFSFNFDKTKSEIEGLEKKVSKNSEFPLTMIPLEVAMVGDGDGMAFPYVLKNIDWHTFFDGKLWVQMNRETAKKEGVSESETIAIQSARGKLGKVKVHLSDVV
ncbi:MAG TPA: molybdopterin-dependent oxidoreductase, partial [Spirochaetota bacterium]|nr:molybdopterin-dependent oxidoreductase [Spirochaetota bacterium]